MRPSIGIDVSKAKLDWAEGSTGEIHEVWNQPRAIRQLADRLEKLDPARIVIDIQGPTGTESPEEQFPGGDSLVTHVGVSKQVGAIRIVLELAVDDPPEFTVFPMADWVLVRIKPVSPHKHPWAHDAG